MSKIAVTFEFLRQYDSNTSNINWTEGEIKIARKILNSHYENITLPEEADSRTIQTTWGQVELLEGDLRVDFLVFTPQRLYVIEVKDYQAVNNFTKPWENGNRSAWKQCSQYMDVVKSKVGNLIEVIGIVLFPLLPISNDLLQAINDYGQKQFSIFSFFSKEINKMSFDSIIEEITNQLYKVNDNYKNMICAMLKLIPEIFAQKELECTVNTPLYVFEKEQISIAKNIGLDGDRIIYGVAGSGKTIILLTKARQISQLYGSEKKVLVICHNKALRKFLQHQLQHTGIEVKTVYAWYNKIIHLWGSSLLEELLSPQEKKMNYYDQVPLLIEYGLDKGKLLPKYDCIFIDEGQDIGSITFRHLKLAHDSEKLNNLFMVFLDNLQAIHQRDTDSFRWIDVGINASGRTRYLRKNYRNAKKIAEYALEVVQDRLDQIEDKSDDLSDKLIRTENIARAGGEVVSSFWLRRDVNYKLAGEIIKQKYNHTIMIIYSIFSDPSLILNVNSALQKLGSTRIIIDCADLEELPTITHIPLYSTYRVKGLEADVVFYLSTHDDAPELNFVANTRAREILYDIRTSWK